MVELALEVRGVAGSIPPRIDLKVKVYAAFHPFVDRLNEYQHADVKFGFGVAPTPTHVVAAMEEGTFRFLRLRSSTLLYSMLLQENDC